MSWTYKGETKKEITDFPPNSYGFIYVITHKPTNKKYIGKTAIVKYWDIDKDGCVIRNPIVEKIL